MIGRMGLFQGRMDTTMHWRERLDTADWYQEVQYELTETKTGGFCYTAWMEVHVSTRVFDFNRHEMIEIAVIVRLYTIKYFATLTRNEDLHHRHTPILLQS